MIRIRPLSIFVVLFFSFAPEDRINLVTTYFNRLVRNQGQLCFDIRAENLKDQETARIVKTDISTNSVSVTYRAKNDFGAYVNGEFNCEFIDGKKLPVTEAERLRYRIHETYLKIKDNQKF
jgi:hypothetical protein